MMICHVYSTFKFQSKAREKFKGSRTPRDLFTNLCMKLRLILLTTETDKQPF